MAWVCSRTETEASFPQVPLTARGQLYLGRRVVFSFTITYILTYIHDIEGCIHVEGIVQNPNVPRACRERHSNLVITARTCGG
jgi:hypothetical protein